MNRSRVALVTAIFVLCAACADDALSPQLSDRFRVPSGARLIGRVVPDLQTYIDGTTPPHRAWVANLAVNGSASRVYGDLRTQAQRLGFRDVASVGQACHTGPDPGAFGGGSGSGAHLVTCSGLGNRPGPGPGRPTRTIRIEVARCALCRPTTGMGRVLFDAGSEAVPAQRVEPLTVSQQTGGSSPRAWVRIPGTAVVRSAWYDACQQNQLVALSVSGDPDEVWQRALDNGLNQVGAVAQTSKRGRVREALTADGSDVVVLTLDERVKPRPILYVALCEG